MRNKIRQQELFYALSNKESLLCCKASRYEKYALQHRENKVKIFYILKQVILVSAFSLCAFGIYAENKHIIETNEIAHLLHHAAACDPQHTLIIFDIDNTIAHLNSPAPLYVGSDTWFECQLEDELKQGKTRAAALEVVVPQYNKAQNRYDLVFVQSTTPQVLQQLQEQKFHTIALTARNEQLIERTLTQLQVLQVNFAAMHMPQRIVLDRDKKVEYVQGIIFVGGGDKGVALKKFLEHECMQHDIRTIIMVDDRRSNLEALLRAFTDQHHIALYCLRYGYMDGHVQTYRQYRLSIAHKALALHAKMVAISTRGSCVTQEYVF